MTQQATLPRRQGSEKHSPGLLLGSARRSERRCTDDICSQKRRLYDVNPLHDLQEGESHDKSFAGGAAFQTSSVEINVHNLTGYTVLPPKTAATFYTRVGSTFKGPDGTTYQLRFHPDAFTCPTGATCVPDLENERNAANMNQPVETAWAQVTYTPQDPNQPWSTSNADRWVVDGELLLADTVYERSTLFAPVGKTPQVPFGQYSMPFKISIVALVPLP